MISMSGSGPSRNGNLPLSIYQYLTPRHADMSLRDSLKDQSLSVLRGLHIITISVPGKGMQEIQLTTNFKNSFRLALDGGGDHNSFGVPSSLPVPPPKSTSPSSSATHAASGTTSCTSSSTVSVTARATGSSQAGRSSLLRSFFLPVVSLSGEAAAEGRVSASRRPGSRSCCRKPTPKSGLCSCSGSRLPIGRAPARA